MSRIYASITGRTMVSCLFQLDLGNIKERYQHMYGKMLFQKVKSETSGDYRKLLLAIIGN